MYNLTEQTKNLLNSFKVAKNALKTSNSIVKIGKVKKLYSDDNFIGTNYFAIKKGLIKTLDNVFNKSNDINNVNYSDLFPKYLTDYDEVEKVNIKETHTQLISNLFTVYMDTRYYLYFTNNLNNIKMYVKSNVDPIIFTDKNDNILGLCLPIRTQNTSDCIVLNMKNDSKFKDIENNIKVNNCCIDINVDNLSIETRNNLKDLGFNYYSPNRVLTKKYSNEILSKLGIDLSHEFFDNENSFEQLQLKQDKKEQIENELVNESYEKALSFYQSFIDGLLNDNQIINNIYIELSPKKTCYYIYIETNTYTHNLGFICCKGCNLDLNKTQQKRLFKMLKENLVLESKKENNEVVNDFYIKTENGEYQKVEGHKLENKYGFDLFYHKIALGNYKITHTPTGVGIDNTITGHKDQLNSKLDDLVNKFGIEKIIDMFNFAIETQGLVCDNLKNENELNENELNKIVSDINDSMEHDVIINIELIENDIKCNYVNKHGENATCYFYKSSSNVRLKQVYDKLIDIFCLNDQLESNLKPIDNFDNVIDKDSLKFINKKQSEGYNIFKLTNDYVLIGNKNNDIFRLSYFDEQINHNRYILPTLRSGKHKSKISQDINKLLKLIE